MHVRKNYEAYLKLNCLFMSMVVKVTCEVCRVNHHPLPAHFRSHKVHFVSSFYTHTHAYGWYSSPLSCPLVPEKGTETCCQKFPFLPFPKDKTHKIGSGVRFDKAAEINVLSKLEKDTV